MPKDGWRGPGQLEAPKLVGAGLVPSGRWDETVDTLPMEGRAANRAGPARLGQSWEGTCLSLPQPLRGLWHAKNLSLAQQRRKEVPHVGSCFHGMVTLAVPPGSSRGAGHPTSEMGPVEGHEV